MNIDLKPIQISEMSETFALLSDSTRLSIVLACTNETKSAGDIAESLNISPSLVSHHLRLLRGARMVRSERKGKQVYYTMTDDCIKTVLETLAEHLFEHNHQSPSIEGDEE